MLKIKEGIKLEQLKEYGFKSIKLSRFQTNYYFACRRGGQMIIVNDVERELLIDKVAEEFVRRALCIAPKGGYIAFLMRIQFLESKSRKVLFEEYPPKYVYVNSERIKVEKNGEFDKYNAKTQCFAWFMWQKGYKGEPIIRFI